MNAEELMVGDWVVCNYYADKPFYKEFGIGDFLKGGYNFVDPIPLTSEILKKNGFVEEHEKPIVDKIGAAIIYGKYKRLDEDNCINYGECLFPIKYVHELQHALRLCGIKKEIVV